MIIYKKEVITLHRFLVLHIRISESLSNQFSSLTQFLNGNYLLEVSELSLQISDSELHRWKQLVAKCMTEYCSSECNKPDNKKLVWIVSKKTAQNLQNSHFSMPGLPTIPEGTWDESERFIFYCLCFFLQLLFIP